ncbi:unnamed protein product, partial [Ectocarpus sp. 12 AP-2014]
PTHYYHTPQPAVVPSTSRPRFSLHTHAKRGGQKRTGTQIHCESRSVVYTVPRKQNSHTLTHHRRKSLARTTQVKNGNTAIMPLSQAWSQSLLMLLLLRGRGRRRRRRRV